MKKTSYQRLKDKLKESQAETRKIRDDFKKVVLNQDFMLTAVWATQFKTEDEFDKVLWNGGTTFNLDEAHKNIESMGEPAFDKDGLSRVYKRVNGMKDESEQSLWINEPKKMIAVKGILSNLLKPKEDNG